MKHYKGLAYDKVFGSRGSVLFCGGLGSAMNGVKATALYEFCKTNDVSFVRFDYSGHGSSHGQFQNGGISQWLQDSLDIFCNLTDGKQIIIGSSMGGWIMFLIALRYPERIQGLIGLAVAPDFTQDLQSDLSVEQKQQLESQGYACISSADGGVSIITSELINDGRKNFVLNQSSIPISSPVILLHGMSDDVVDYTKSLDIAMKLESDKVSVQLLKNGIHSMNDVRSLEALYRSILELLE